MAILNRRTPLHAYEARRIALIKPSALGDIVHSLPVLTALRHRYPGAHLAWVVNKIYAPLLEGHPDLNEVIAYDRSANRRSWMAGLRAHLDLWTTLRRAQFDLVIDLQGLFRSGVMCLATRARRTVGLKGAREGAGWVYTDTVDGPDRRSGHAVDRYWRVAETLGVGHLPKVFRVPLQQHALDWARGILQSYPRPLLGLAVGARWLTKRWPPEHFAALARRAVQQFGGTVLLVGAPDEFSLAEQTAQLVGHSSLQLAGRTTLPQLAAVLSCLDVLIANDTGPLHLAAALGRPVVAPYTCTKVALTGPYGAGAHGVETRVWCAGSLLRRCDRMECMRELTPDRLWPFLDEILQRWQHTRQSA